MKTEELQQKQQAFETLRRFAGSKPARSVEHCQLCSAALLPEHPHLIELGERQFLCSCDACAILFSGRAGTKYRRLPRSVRRFSDFVMTDAEWDALMIPISLAFFYYDSAAGRVSALYPSPAGATESLLPLSSWNNIVEVNPALRQLEPDVEALLVNRVGHARGASAAEYYIVPIDSCYKLVGLIRMHWRGLSGGTEVWQEIGKFFADLQAKAQPVSEEIHA